MHPSVFLGLVTHRGTRFPEASGPDGLVRRVAARLDHLGVMTTVSVHDEDRFSTDHVALTRRSVRASIRAELSVEQQWRIYLNPGISRTRLALVVLARKLYRVARLAPPWRGSSATPAGARMLRRLVNIELAHLALMSDALASGSTWTLIVEDDARVEHPEEFADALARFIETRTHESEPDYVNVSRSFTHGALGIESLLSPAAKWSDNATAFRSARPLTNTVCAVLYRTAFLEELKAQLDRIPTSPVLPIDWKLNSALMALRGHGQVPVSCWTVDPAPVIQGSMVG